jgi:hypothetical protein
MARNSPLFELNVLAVAIPLPFTPVPTGFSFRFSENDEFYWQSGEPLQGISSTIAQEK